MKTKLEIIAELKAQNPTLKSGNDEQGYEDLSPSDYEATIQGWAENQFVEQNAIAQTETEKAALLAKLGITADEAKLLLS
jgi:hypothetical protein